MLPKNYNDEFFYCKNYNDHTNVCWSRELGTEGYTKKIIMMMMTNSLLIGFINILDIKIN